jgi:hypothetical protein
MQTSELKSSAKTPRWPLWSVLWRTLIFGPILMPLGAAALAAVLASIFASPVFIGILFIEGHYFLAPVALVGWLFWLRTGFRLLRWMLQGMEYSSL